MTKMGKGMQALQDRVAGAIIRQGSFKDRTSCKVFRMRDDFKLHTMKSANRAGLSYEAWIRLAMAEKSKWEGEL